MHHQSIMVAAYITVSRLSHEILSENHFIMLTIFLHLFILLSIWILKSSFLSYGRPRCLSYFEKVCLLTIEKSDVSSANILHIDLIPSGISFI